MPLPPFARGRGWIKRASNAVNRRLWYEPRSGYEYEICFGHGGQSWHQIDPISRQYRDVDRVTGSPVPGKWGRWRALQ